MSRQRVAIWTIALVALVAAVGYRWHVFRQPPLPPTPTVAFITGGSSPYWQLTVAGAKAAARDHKVNLSVEIAGR